jgi:nitrite reductase/ring-hydroxylating ferredoxin subunit
VRDFAEGAARFSMILVRVGEEVRGYVNSCPHARWPLERLDGQVPLSEGVLICAAHGASFDWRSGACLGGPAKRGLEAVAIALADGWVLMG